MVRQSDKPTNPNQGQGVLMRKIWQGSPPGYHDATDRTCRECKEPLPNRRTTRFCSKACGEAFWSRRDWKRLRILVFVRDHYTCVRCGFVSICPYQVWHQGKGHRHDCPGTGLQGDHIIPIADGGNEFDIDNVRTLCVDCHKIITAEWHAKRKG